jgi:hypothetical protein
VPVVRLTEVLRQAAKSRIIVNAQLCPMNRGGLGVASRIDMEEGELHADFDGRAVTYAFGELDESQGADAEALVVQTPPGALLSLY